MSRASVVNNVIITSLGKYGETLIALVASAIVARALGPSDYGVYTYVIFICGWMIRLSNISLPATAIRFIAESRGSSEQERAVRVAGVLLRRQTINSLLVFAGFLVFIRFFTPEVLADQSALLFVLVGMAVFFKARYIFTISIAKGYERFDVEAISVVAVGLVNIAMVLFLAASGQGIDSFVMVFTVTCCLMLMCAWLLCRSNGIDYHRGAIEPDYLDKVHRYRRQALLLGMVALLGGSTLEMFLLGHYASAAQVGFFALSIALTRGLNELCTEGLTTILMPRMAHAFGASNIKAVRHIFLESTRYYVFFGVGLSLWGFVVADPIILLVYGSEYAEASWVFNAMLLITGFGMSSAAVGAYLSTTDNQDIRVKFAVTVLVIHLILVFALVPFFGLRGALLSSALTQLVSTSLGLGWVVRNLGVAIPVGLYSRLLLSGCIALTVPFAISFYASHVLIDLVAATAFPLLYLVTTIAMGCWTLSDLDLVRHVLGLLPERIGAPLLRIISKWSSD